ncbi:MAG: hypothetical protein IPK20_22745 [Betaproteobacteria bacterium]|nr:hypothetical protein [Betaproteobacteria bacterium]
MDIDVTLPGAGITGTLGFLQVDASDNGNTGLGASIAVDLYTTTGEDERVGITDFGNIRLNAGVAAEANVDLGLELRLNNELIPNAESAFPKLQADFVLEWAIGDRDAGEFVSFSAIGDSIQEGLKLVEFRNIGMDMGTFISQYVQPIVKEVQKITEPLQPLIDALTTPIPVISDLAGKPMTLIDIAQAITPPEKFNVGLIRDIAGFITLINNIPTDTDTLFIPFGGFKVYDINNPNLRGNLSSRNSTVRQTLTPTNTSSYDFNQTMSQLQASNPGASRTTTFTKNLGNQTFGQMISFPIITDPGPIFGLLMGNDVTLVRIDPQPLLFDFRYSQFFPIWGPLGAAIEGRFNVAIDFAFGYDTLGIKRFFDGGFKNPLSLIDGFFIDDLNTSGVDIPEVHFGGGITASAEINLGVAKAGVGGGIFFTVDFNLHDPDEDGKIRLYELATNFLNEFKYGEPALSPLAVFDVTGRIFAKLFAYLKIDLLLFSVDKEFNITPEITIVDFDIPFTRIPTLATELPDGVLQLNMGKYSKDRLEGNENDIAEQFFVKQSGAGKVKVWAPNLGVTESMAQEYDVDSRIIALGGEGDDIIDLSQVTDTNIVAEVEGGTGNDIIRLGAGRGIVKGGDGDDTIEGSDLADIIYGEGGADKISGKGGNDFIAADKARLDKEEVVLSAGASLADGADIVDGGAGDDIIIGGGGADVIGGDADPGTAPGADTPAGNDVIFADGVVFTLTAAGDFFSFDPATVKDTNKGASGGADIVFGNGGNDRIWGGKGDDTIQGNTGDDTIFGEDGFDTLQGNDGADTIDGGKQDNTILGGAGNDTLIGGDNKDFIRGNTGQDTIRGGAGSDEIYGDEEDDTIFGESDADKIYGGGGADIIDGGAGNNLIFGDDKDGENTGTAGGDTITTLNDSNTIHGQDGDDVITSGDGLDLIFGDAGNDTIQAGGGKDLVFGGVGNDIIRTGAGNDRVLGEDGNDTVFGDAGIDEILGGLGNDLLYGGIGEAGGDTGANSIDGGLGDDQIWGDLGNDTILGDDGSDTIHGLAGNDDIDGGDDLDHIFGDGGDDRIIGGFGNDDLHGGGGQDIIWGGFEKVGRANFDLNVSSNFINPFAFDLNEARFDTGFVPPRINAVALDNLSVDGDLADGQDSLHGDGGIDFLFGGFDTDDLFGGDDSDYLDGGVSDAIVRGQRGHDVIRGGGNNDTLFGGTGIDQLYGDSGADFLYGDAGRDNDAGVTVNGIGGDQSAVNGQQAGQRLYGGDGVDRLHAYSDVRLIDGDAAIAAETARIGDELHGGSGNDLLFGNLRQDTLLGDDGNDYLHGDRLAGPVYGDSVLADIIGGSDLLFGGSGQDQLFGGGGDDDLWGGADGDRIKGQNGIDRLYGGGGIDLLLMDVETEYDPLPAGVNEVFDGHFGNDFENDVLDDNATDILEIKGSNEYDTILLGQLADGRLHVDYTRENPVLSTFRRDFYTAVWLDADGNPLVEQFQVEGQGGNDTIAFRDADAVVNGTQVLKLDLSLLAARSDDFVGVFDGGPGNDTLIGGAARDRLDGGTGDDTMYGFGGDDRLWGGVGSTSDVDYLYGGQGNDDAIGGSGRNFLFAWSRDPKAGGQFGVYVDAQGGLHDNDGDLDNDGRLDSDATKTPYVLEDTGLNRMLGSAEDDELYGGTGVDFMFGNGGNDKLFRADGTLFESLDGGLLGNDWKEYAKQNSKVWYVAGTNANDEIAVDYVTEPGLLSDYHLVTRLTNNNGASTFAAQVRLDAQGTDSNGNPTWDATDVVIDTGDLDAQAAAIDVNSTDRTLALEAINFLSTNLANQILGGEGDYDVILIDSLGGDDRVSVGPTVQKTVWVDAGDGDDTVLMRSGQAILVDAADRDKRNDVRGLAQSLGTGPLTQNTTVQGLTIDNPLDADWFRFSLASAAGAGARVRLNSASSLDGLGMALYDASGNEVGTGPVSLQLQQDILDATSGNDSFTDAFALPDVRGLARVDGLTLHNAADEDFFRFTLATGGAEDDQLGLVKASATDDLRLEIYNAAGIKVLDGAAAGHARPDPDGECHRSG